MVYRFFMQEVEIHYVIKLHQILADYCTFLFLVDFAFFTSFRQYASMTRIIRDFIELRRFTF